MNKEIIGIIDYNNLKNKGFMPILWDGLTDIVIWKSIFNSQYGKRITWLKKHIKLNK